MSYPSLWTYVLSRLRTAGKAKESFSLCSSTQYKALSSFEARKRNMSDRCVSNHARLTVFGWFNALSRDSCKDVIGSVIRIWRTDEEKERTDDDDWNLQWCHCKTQAHNLDMHSHDASYGLVMNRILILYFIFNFIDKKSLQCHLPQDRFLKGTARCQSTKSTPSWNIIIRFVTNCGWQLSVAGVLRSFCTHNNGNSNYYYY